MVFIYDEDKHNPEEAYQMGIADAQQGLERRPLCECLDCMEAYWRGYSQESTKGKQDNGSK